MIKKPIQKALKCALVSITLLMPAFGFSQKLYKTSIDKATNDTVKSTSQERIASKDSFTSAAAEYVQAYVYKINSNVFLNLETDITVEGHKYYDFEAGKKVIFKLADNTVIEFVNKKSVTPEGKTIKKGLIEREYMVASLNFPISMKDVSKILSSSITSINFESNEQSFELELKPKDNQVFKKMFTLINESKSK